MVLIWMINWYQRFYWKLESEVLKNLSWTVHTKAFLLKRLFTEVILFELLWLEYEW